MQNPYGAVPEAIKDMRVSLRDIMADVLATKKMEGDLSLARAKAETDTALINAENERHKLANEKDIARMQQQDTQFNRQLDQSASQFQQTQTLAEAAQRFSQGPAFDETRRVNTAHVRHLNAQTAELGRKAREDAEVVTAQQYATERGAVHLLPMFGIDPNQKMTRKQFEGFGSQIDAMVRSNPMIMVIANGKKLQMDLDNLSGQYKTPGLDAATKEKIGGDIKAKREQLEKLDYFIMASKDPDPVKVAAEAHKTWTDNPDLATQYKNYDEYHQAFADSIRTARGRFHEGINNIKFFEATKDISPTYLEDVQSAQALVAAMPDQAKAQQISAHGKKLLSQGKYKEAHEYMTQWGKYLQNAPRQAPPKSQAPQKDTRAVPHKFSLLDTKPENMGIVMR